MENACFGCDYNGKVAAPFGRWTEPKVIYAWEKQANPCLKAKLANRLQPLRALNDSCLERRGPERGGCKKPGMKSPCRVRHTNRCGRSTSSSAWLGSGTCALSGSFGLDRLPSGTARLETRRSRLPRRPRSKQGMLWQLS